MNKVSESIFSYTVGVETITIPMADVCYVEREEWTPTIGEGFQKRAVVGGRVRLQYFVHLKDKVVKLKEFMGKKFMRAWCTYRYELEGGKDAFIQPEDTAKEKK